MQKLYYHSNDEKSAINTGSDLPQDAYNVLEVSFDELGINGSILPYIEWTSEGITTDLEQAKATMNNAKNQSKINADARDYLSSTDWYIVRLTETGEVVPQDILTLREQARLSVVE